MIKKVTSILIAILCLLTFLGAYTASASNWDWREQFIHTYEQNFKDSFGDSCRLLAPDNMEDYVYLIFSDNSLSEGLVSVTSKDTATIEAYNILKETANATTNTYHGIVTKYNENGHFAASFINPLDDNKILFTSVDGIMLNDALEEISAQAKEAQAQAESAAPAAGSEAAPGPFDIDLTAGHYVGGLGIPTGVYSITWVANSGNVHSPMSVNEIFRPDRTTEYNNFHLFTGTELEISGALVVHLHTDNANYGSYREREIKSEVETILPPGNYVAGTDFPEGTYYIMAYDGRGNVHSYEAGVNEIIAVEPDEYSIYQYNYATFKVGDPLEVSSCTIMLSPAGD